VTHTNKKPTKRITKEEKTLLQKKTNQENLAAAINTINIQANYYYKVNRNSKNMIHELSVLLNLEDQKIPLSVRAATAISIIDSMSQDRRLASHIRPMLWQVVSNLEGIRD
jgi:hypothetical protein